MKARHLEFIPRAGQVLFCAVCVATASAIAYATAPTIPLGIWIAICASAGGLVYSSFRILVHFYSRKIEKAMPGIIDLLTAATFAAGLLSAGINVATVGSCYARNGTAVIMPRDAVPPAAEQSSVTAAPSQSLPAPFGGMSSSSGAAATSNAPYTLNHLAAAGAQGDHGTATANAAADIAVVIGSSPGRRRLHRSHHGMWRSTFAGGYGSALEWQTSRSFSGDSNSGTFPASARRLLSSVQSVSLRNSSVMICSCWDATVTLCFLNFLLYAISAAVACLDIRLGKGILVINKKAIVDKFFDQHGEGANASGEGSSGDRAPGSIRSESEFGDADVDIIIVPVQELVTQPVRAPRRSSTDVQR